MSQLWSEINKVVNVLDLKAQSSGASTGIACDIVNMANYKKLTYLITLGSSGTPTNTPTVTVCAGETDSGATTAIVFKYRTQIAGAGGSTGDALSDVPSALTTTTGTAGFAMSSGDAGGMYIIEVDAPTVCAATTGTTYYDHVKLLFTNATTAEAQIYGVTAVLSEPRYPQAILVTAID